MRGIALSATGPVSAMDGNFEALRASTHQFLRGGTKMAKGQQKGNKEARKPKKAGPPKQNASNPSTKGNNSGVGKAG